MLPLILRAVRGALAEGPLDRIEVRHLASDGSEGGRAARFAGEQISGKGVTAEGIAEGIVEEIEQDARNFSGVQSYAVLFYKVGEPDYFRRKLVEVRGRDNTSDKIERSEPANEKGATSMTMRHLETREVALTQRERLVAQQSENLINRLSGMVEKMAETFPRILEAEQALLDRKAERTLEIRRAEKQDKIVEKGVEKLMMYGGPLMAKLLPKIAGSEGTAVATDAMLIDLVSSMTPEQLQTFIATLRPEQRAVFIELYQALRARHQEVKLSDDSEKHDDTTNPNGASS